MAAPKGNTEIIRPDLEFELPFKKNSEGNYIIVAKKRANRILSQSNKNKHPHGYLYFIKASGYDFYKIGVSKNPIRRINDIDSYLPFDLEILSLHYFEDVYDVETKFILELHKHKIRREWYSLTTDEAKEIIIQLHNLNVERYVCSSNR